MSDRPSTARARDVPAGRLNRAARFGTLAAGVAGNMAVNGLVQLGRGARPSARDLLLTPGNIRRVTDELAKMRGAAMKIGQLMSMDTGDVFPEELTEIMARLRADADFMPPKQLRRVLDTEWGAGWMAKFSSFDVRPIAAASIGQVHRARLKTGEDLAIKVQYPGIARSIDADVANVGRLIRLSGLVPPGFDIGPYLDEARAQLHDEADYALEATHLDRFVTLLGDDPDFALPRVHGDLTTARVLAMTFVEGRPIEEAESAPQALRDRIGTRLMGLALRELFGFGIMQTDPNLANYRYNPESGRVILLDFGATRVLSRDTVEGFRAILAAGLAQDRKAILASATAMGLMAPETEPRFADQIVSLIAMVFSEITRQDTLDFGASDLSQRMQRAGQTLAEDGYVPAPIPIELLFAQRKIAGVFLIATRLNAKVPARQLIADSIT